MVKNILAFTNIILMCAEIFAIILMHIKREVRKWLSIIQSSGNY